ncbi:MAG: hypothetical protein IPN97_16385 [Saprospiraceae bacterium]|nr:hypothetical protein [Saprospiraceae bacterium]
MIQSYVLRDNPLQKPAECWKLITYYTALKSIEFDPAAKTASINAMITDWNENPSLADAVEN